MTFTKLKTKFTRSTFIAVFTLVVIILPLFSSIAYAAGYSDIPQNANYKTAVENLTNIGILNGTSNGKFMPNVYVSRDQFTKLLIIASGLETDAKAAMGTSAFPDVKPNNSYSGFIFVATQKGYISSMYDGKFHPADKITFAQVCTMMVRALGYTDKDVPGVWPRNYIEKANVLGLTKGFTYKNNSSIPKWSAAIMLDRMLKTEVKKASQVQLGTSSTVAASEIFGISNGLLQECIILDDSFTKTSLKQGQVQTNNGLLTVKSSKIALKPGLKYILRIQDTTVTGIYETIDRSENISVSNLAASLGTIAVTGLRANVKVDINLTSDMDYYYAGKKIDVDAAKTALKPYSALVINTDNYNKSYVVIYDPVYSKAHIVDYGDTYNLKAGDLILSNINIVRNGDLINPQDLAVNDVIYQISDIWNQQKYITVYSNKVTGWLKNYSPTRYSPESISIEAYNSSTRKNEITAYSLSKDFDLSKLEGNNFKVGQYVNLILGVDGKIVGITT